MLRRNSELLELISHNIINGNSELSCTLETQSFCFLFAVFYWVVDVKGYSLWTYPLRVVGMNALAAYVMQTFLPISAISRFFFGGIASLSGIPNVVNSIGYLAVCWLILYFLHRQKVYLKV